jgi:hypothetical protein
MHGVVHANAVRKLLIVGVDNVLPISFHFSFTFAVTIVHSFHHVIRIPFLKWFSLVFRQSYIIIHFIKVII